MKETEKVPFDSMPPLIRGLFLTKEQVKKLKEPFKDVVSVVRCKDCKYFPNGDGSTTRLPCMEIITAPGWFCADGKRKSADEKLMDEMDADPLG